MRALGLVALLVVMAGCASTKEITPPSKAVFDQTVEEKYVFGSDGQMVYGKDGKPMTTKVVSVHSEGTGVGAASDALKSLNATAPTATADQATGSEVKVKTFNLAEIGANTTLKVWQLAIGVALAVGGALLCKVTTELGVPVLGIGAALVVAIWFPWVMWAIALILLFALGVLIYSYFKGKKVSDTLDAVVSAIEKTSSSVQSAVKDKVSEVADDWGLTKTVKETVSESKEK